LPLLGLGAAYIVDGTDGSMAGRFLVASTPPRFSGEDFGKVTGYFT